jgi:DNA-binding beta-propeller fold protein YncE
MRLKPRTLLFVFVATCSCVCSVARDQDRSKPTEPASLAWPPPPDQARVIYVRSFNNPLDLGIKPSVFKRFGNWITGGGIDERRILNPLGISLDEKGNVCFTDTAAKTISCVDIAAKRWQQWDHAGSIHFSMPVAVAKKVNTLYVADSALSEVVAFDTGGKLLFEINHDLGRPSGLVILGDKLFVTDVEQHCVVAFDLRGRKLSTFGKRGTGSGEFNFPTHASTDRHGQLLITDAMNSRVQIFDADGNFRGEIGGAGDTSGNFGRPKGVAVDSFGHIYVADAVFDNIQVFDFSGRLLLNLGETGSGAGQFGLPNGVAIGADNQIYVADSYNHRVQVFKYIGQQ